MEKIKNSKLAILLLCVGAVYFFLKYIVPIVSPALLAMLFLAMVGSTLKAIQNRFKIPRHISVIIILVITVAILAGIIWLCGLWIEDNFGSLTKNIGGLLKFVGFDINVIEDFLSNIPDRFGELFDGKLWDVLWGCVGYGKNIAAFGAFIIIFCITTVLLAKDYDNIMNAMLDREELRIPIEVLLGVIRYVACMLKTQIIILSIIGTICAIILGISGVNYGVFWGITAGIFDALPFIGTGIILFPVAIFQIVKEEYLRAFICGALYIVCVVIRNYLEPKLIGKKVGLPSVAVLLSLYAGVKLFGAVGVLMGPLGLIIVWEIWKSLDDSGVS